MATYNGERFLREQIDSILCQLGPDDELIVSDDGSTDGTLGIIESYGDLRIRLLHHRKKPEYARIRHSRNFYYATDNFENALKAARGDYVFLADQDDVWMENKAELCLAELRNSACVVHNMQVIDEFNVRLSPAWYKENPVPGCWPGIVWRMPLRGCCMGFRRAVLEDVLPFPPGLMVHDYWIAAICLKRFSIGYVALPLIQYREHNNSTSYMVRNPLAHKIKYRARLFLQILLRRPSSNK